MFGSYSVQVVADVVAEECYHDGVTAVGGDRFGLAVAGVAEVPAADGPVAVAAEVLADSAAVAVAAAAPVAVGRGWACPCPKVGYTPALKLGSPLP